MAIFFFFLTLQRRSRFKSVYIKGRVFHYFSRDNTSLCIASLHISYSLFILALYGFFFFLTLQRRSGFRCIYLLLVSTYKISVPESCRDRIFIPSFRRCLTEVEFRLLSLFLLPLHYRAKNHHVRSSSPVLL